MAFLTAWTHGGRPLPLLVLAALPVLLLGPALEGMVAWFHAHGPAGRHVHLVALPPRSGDSAALEAEHEARHRHDPPAEDSREDGRDPDESLIEFPALLAPLPQDSASPAGIEIPAPVSLFRWHPTPAEGQHRPGLFRSGWPPLRASRSGIAAILRKGHAILI